jgi:hypothetical protein
VKTCSEDIFTKERRYERKGKVFGSNPDSNTPLKKNLEDAIKKHPGVDVTKHFTAVIYKCL